MSTQLLALYISLAANRVLASALCLLPLIAPDAIAQKSREVEFSPLFQAILKPDNAQVQALFKRGVSPNSRDRGWTPLHAAAESGNLTAAELLFSAGGQIDAQISEGQTPLHTAATRGQQEVAEFLLNTDLRSMLMIDMVRHRYSRRASIAILEPSTCC